MQFEDSNNQPLVWHRLWRTLKCYWLLIVVSLVFSVVCAYASLELTTEQYDISASIMVKLGRENFEAASLGTSGGLYTTTGVRPEDINSKIELLTSRQLIQNAVEKIGVDAFSYKEPPPPETLFQAVKYYAKKSVRYVKSEFQNLLIALNLKKRLPDFYKVILDIEDRLVVERQKESDVISVKIRLPDPKLGEKLLDTLIQLFMDRHIEVHREANLRAFMESQATNYLAQLNDLDRQREEVRGSTMIASVDEQKRLLINRLNVIHQDVDTYRAELEVLRKEVMNSALDIDSDVEDTSELISEPGALKLVRERIANLQAKLIDLLERYDSNADTVKELRDQINRLENLLLRSINAHIVRQQQMAAGLQRQLSQISSGEDQLEIIERERSIAENNYLLYIKKREEARISEELDRNRVSNLSILSKPFSSLEPVYPKRLLIMGISIPLGLVIGIALAMLLDYFKNIVRVQDDLADVIGLNYLGNFKVPRH